MPGTSGASGAETSGPAWSGGAPVTVCASAEPASVKPTTAANDSETIVAEKRMDGSPSHLPPAANIRLARPLAGPNSAAPVDSRSAARAAHAVPAKREEPFAVKSVGGGVG